MKKIILLLVFSLFVISPVFAGDYDDATPTGLGVSVGAWIQPNFSGIVKAGPNGTEISLNNNLGLPRESMIVPHIWYRWPHGQIFGIRYAQYDKTVTTNLNAPEVFQGVNFPQGASVTTKTQIQWADISYELPIAYDVFPPHESFLNAVVNVKAIRGVFRMTNNATGGVGVHDPITVPVPMAGLHGKARVLSETDLEFRAAGIRFGFLDSIGWSYDLEAGVTQKLYEGLSVSGKYRYFTLYNRDSQDHRFAFRFFGPEVTANYHF